MGGGSFTSTDWSSFKSSATTDKKTGRKKSREEIFTRSRINPDFDPKKFDIRESVDSPDNPNSTPIIVALDVTGSMHDIPEALIKDGLGTMATEILDRKPVTDPHIMFMAVGDAAFDTAPLQATQFEADIRIAEQLKELWLEGRGGGNHDESYHLPWYMAARKTQIDSFDKRGEKGLLFTMGDEGVPPSLEASHVKKVFGDDLQADIPTEELLRMVEERYDVFHIVVEQGNNYRHRPSYVDNCWKPLLGQRALYVSDYTKIPEVIVSTIEVIAGKPKAEVAASWSGDTSLVVRDAVQDLTVGSRGGPVAKGGTNPSAGPWRPKKRGGPA